MSRQAAAALHGAAVGVSATVLVGTVAVIATVTPTQVAATLREWSPFLAAAHPVLVQWSLVAVALVAFLVLVWSGVALTRLRTLDPQPILTHLAQLRADGAVLLNQRPSTLEERDRLIDEIRQWREGAQQYLDRCVPRHAPRFRTLGSLRASAFPQALDDVHNQQLLMLARRLEILDDISTAIAANPDQPGLVSA